MSRISDVISWYNFKSTVRSLSTIVQRGRSGSTARKNGSGRMHAAAILSPLLSFFGQKRGFGDRVRREISFGFEIGPLQNFGPKNLGQLSGELSR
jgi:hypothetical protein